MTPHDPLPEILSKRQYRKRTLNKLSNLLQKVHTQYHYVQPLVPIGPLRPVSLRHCVLSLIILPLVPHHHTLVAIDSAHCALPLETTVIEQGVTTRGSCKYRL